MALTTHPSKAVVKERKSRATRLLPLWTLVASSRMNFTVSQIYLNKTVFVFSVITVCLVHMYCFYSSVINTPPHHSFTVPGGNTSALVHTASSHFTSAPRSKQEIRHSPMYKISATIIFGCFVNSSGFIYT